MPNYKAISGYFRFIESYANSGFIQARNIDAMPIPDTMYERNDRKDIEGMIRNIERHLGHIKMNLNK